MIETRSLYRKEFEMEFKDTSSIEKYHAHVYFDKSTVEQAQSLCKLTNG